MGLFDNLWTQDPDKQAQLSLAANLLASRGGNVNQAIGNALTASQGQYGSAQEMLLKRMLANAQMQDQQSQAMLREAQAKDITNGMNLSNWLLGGGQGGPPQGQVPGGQPSAQQSLPQLPPSAQTTPQAPQRNPQAPQPTGSGGTIASLSPEQVQGLSRYMKDLPAMWKMAKEGFHLQEGWNAMPDGSYKFVPIIRTSQNGQTTVTYVDDSGQMRVAIPPGALESNYLYGLAGGLGNAATSIKEFQGPGGEPRLASGLQVLQNAGAISALPRLDATGTQLPPITPRQSGQGGQPAPAAPQSSVLPTMPPSAPAPAATQKLPPLAGGGLGMPAGQTTRVKAETQTAGTEDAKRQADTATQADQARTSLSNIGLMKDVVDQGGFSPGAGTELFNSKVGPWLARLPGNPYGDQVSSYEQFAKNSIQLSTAAARTMGAREPGSVIQMFRGAYPNSDMQKSSLQVLLTQQEASQHYAISKQQFMDNWQSQKGSLAGADSAWNKSASQEAMFYMTMAKNYPEAWKRYYQALPKGSQQQVASKLQAASAVGMTAD